MAAGLQWADLFDTTGEGRTVPKEKPSLVGPAGIAGLRVWLDALTLNQATVDYAAERFGMDEASLADYGIKSFTPNVDDSGYLPISRSFASYPRMVVPLLGFDGVARGVQGRDLSGQCPGRWVSLRNPRGHRWAPYGVFRGQGGYGVALVSEGPGDGLTAVSVGYDAVAVRGASLAGSADLIAELAEGLRGTQVIACGDNDEAGQRFNRMLAKGLAQHGIKVYALPIPHPKDDLTKWRERDPHGFPLALHRAVKAAKPVRNSAEAEAEAVSAELTDRTGADVVSRDQGSEAARILAGLINRYGESDAMNAHALVAWTDGRIKYAPGLGYYVWNGRTWERSEVKIRQEIHRMGAALVLAGETQKARGYTMTVRIDALMTELRSVPTVHVDASAFDAQPDLLSFRNGTVNLRTGELRPHAKEDMLTYSLDIDYRPEAACPRWEAFLAEIFPDNPELPAYMRRLVGYGITGHVSEQAFCVLWGKGANGKSVFTETLTGVFRAISKTTPFSTFEEKASGGIPNDIAALRGCRLAMASEGESGKPMSEAILKRVTGKDMISARFLRQEFFEFRPAFLLMLATNHRPKFRGQDDGLWRRVKMIPFKRWFAPHERDYYLDAKLAAEAEGIAAWAVRGAVDWFATGLSDPEVIVSAVREYKATSDALAGFFPDGPLVRDADALLPGDEAYSAYREWCEAEGLQQREVWKRNTFYAAMEERGAVKKRTSKGIALVGVRSARVPVTGPGILGA
ncbi:phage/plasmid primase, P4 family [Streptomyces sp. SP17KL33]|uniref:phage/plasmid primase, P4 family n=1 Tax=Streptomyces sp. SP17KL33 TaxID=3002534 RepID=UPI002E7AA7BA|nr:phage/plasmid primase, P4 family [Streptomyces sp. SP17KL33]MEE1835775.1 phage/plasmid primase, P4 family [Streptomyces sp. SP17KL33]